MSLTPRKTTTKALRRLTRALTDNGAGATPITIPARVLLRILDKLQDTRTIATNEANRASQNYRAWEELRQELARRTQQAQDNAPTPDELLTPGSDYARGARAAAQEIHRVLTGADQVDDGITLMEPVRTALERLTGLLDRVRANERARIANWATDTSDPLTADGQITVTELRNTLISQRATQITDALSLTGPGRALERYRHLRTRYSAEHDAAHHERADFRMAALALLLRPDMKVAVVTSISNTGHEKVNALFTAEALWEGTGLGPFPTLLQGQARNDALAAALLMCSLDRDTAPAPEEGPQS